MFKFKLLKADNSNTIPPEHIIAQLNPADYFTLAMDEEIRKDGMPGSLCGFALELDSSPDITLLQKHINEFTQRFAICNAQIRQNGRHFYWCKQATKRQFFFHHQCPQGENPEQFQQQALEGILNRVQSRTEITALEFHLISSATLHCFLIRWIHPFCDARSAEIILRYLCTEDAQQRLQFDNQATQDLLAQQLRKYRWWEKIGLLIKAKRHIESLDNLTSVLPYENQQAIKPQRLHFTRKCLSEEHTQLINKNIRKTVGLTGTSLYYIGSMIRALEKMNSKNIKNMGEAYCVPYAFNLRKNKAISPVLGNHVGSLFAQVPRDLVTDRQALFQHLKQQNTDVIRSKKDVAFFPLMWAASWLSLEEYGKTLRYSTQSEDERSSFWFSDIGQPDMSQLNLAGSDITGLIHLCQISSPPALALLSCQYQQCLSLTYNFIAPYFNQQWIDTLHQHMLQELLDL